MRSPTTLLTAGWLRPLPRIRSWRVNGPSRKSLDSNAERFRTRTLRFVARANSTRHLDPRFVRDRTAPHLTTHTSKYFNGNIH
ncbi:hypothetical protein JD81_02348 [Micromonospora sagamiensis]|uniref:Uncharacterized protein n=1 Tax=Micromonospora sagamiensis TaxID=47875 RepID=A0A562WEY2_9ACTN|nr:hypothetical protein JD81_02348 [Micromonospora sagamiensis]